VSESLVTNQTFRSKGSQKGKMKGIKSKKKTQALGGEARKKPRGISFLASPPNNKGFLLLFSPFLLHILLYLIFASTITTCMRPKIHKTLQSVMKKIVMFSIAEKNI